MCHGFYSKYDDDAVLELIPPWEVLMGPWKVGNPDLEDASPKVERSTTWKGVGDGRGRKNMRQKPPETSDQI
jgi:hypothetical protein